MVDTPLFRVRCHGDNLRPQGNTLRHNKPDNLVDLSAKESKFRESRSRTFGGGGRRIVESCDEEDS
jgi:hypothetical protein